MAAAGTRAMVPWACGVCTYENPAAAAACEVCSAARPRAAPPPSAAGAKGGWRCDCGFTNRAAAQRSECRRCKKPAPDHCEGGGTKGGGAAPRDTLIELQVENIGKLIGKDCATIKKLQEQGKATRTWIALPERDSGGPIVIAGPNLTACDEVVGWIRAVAGLHDSRVLRRVAREATSPTATGKNADRRLFVRGLAPGADKEGVKRMLEQVGSVERVHWVGAGDDGGATAIVEMLDAAGAEKAVRWAWDGGVGVQHARVLGGDYLPLLQIKAASRCTMEAAREALRMARSRDGDERRSIYTACALILEGKVDKDFGRGGQAPRPGGKAGKGKGKEKGGG